MTTETLEFALIARVREVVAGAPATEVELRRLSEHADAWARTLEGQLQASEGRLAELSDDASSPLSAMADELRRIEKLRPELNGVRSHIGELDGRARELRTLWLMEQAASEAPRTTQR